MADTLSSEERSLLMGRIRGKDTKPEIAVRRMLHSMGYRFRDAIFQAIPTLFCHATGPAFSFTDVSGISIATAKTRAFLRRSALGGAKSSKKMSPATNAMRLHCAALVGV